LPLPVDAAPAVPPEEPRNWPITCLCAVRTPNRLICHEGSVVPGFYGGDSMQDTTQAKLVRPVPSIIPADVPALSDDECLARLAQAVEVHDSAQLDEVARLIGRLVVTIE
jgi:hypothetical protein